MIKHSTLKDLATSREKTNHSRDGRRASFAAALVGSALLVACMAPPHQSPVSGPRATLTIARASGASSGRLFSYLFDGGLGSNNGLKCPGKSALPPIDFDSDETRVTEIVAGRRTLLVLNEYSRTSATTCYVAIEFDPEDGKRYQATWSTSGGQCFVRLGRFENSSGKNILVPERSVGPNFQKC